MSEAASVGQRRQLGRGLELADGVQGPTSRGAGLPLSRSAAYSGRSAGILLAMVAIA